MTAKKPKDIQKSWDALAGMVGVPLRRIHEDRNKPGAPTTKSLSEWRAFLSINRDLNASSEERVQLRMKIQREELRKLQNVNEAQETRIRATAQEAAEEIIDRMMARIRAALLGQLPGQLAAGLKGQPLAEAEIAARRLIEAGLQSARPSSK